MYYRDLDLIIERITPGYKVRVISPAMQASHTFAIPFSKIELENFLLKIGRPRRGVRRMDSPEMQAAKQFGARLFDAVFDHDVRDCLRSNMDEAKPKSEGVRLRLHLDAVPELAEIPWEYLYYSKLNRFFSLSVETPIIRYLDLPERIQALRVTPPVQILVMISSPFNYPPLNVEGEWEKLNEALHDLEKRDLVTLTRLGKANLAALQKQLRRGDYHIFHFIGHGGFDRQAQDGVLILEDDFGRGYPVSGQNLGALLHDEPTLRLALLNACEGARGGIEDPFSGTAQSLVQQGVPAVIAMQFEVTDKTAITLAHEFYTALAEGLPVDTALGEARKAIFAQGNDIEWGTPVLYMRAPDGKIFDIEQTRRQKTAPLPPRLEPPPPSRKWKKLTIGLAAGMVMGLTSYFVWKFAQQSKNAEVSQQPAAAYVSFEINPPTAEVRIDGEMVQARGFGIIELSSGRHELALSQEGYEAVADSFQLAPGETLIVNRTLAKLPQNTAGIIEPEPESPVVEIATGALSITSDPSRAEIWLQNKKRGLTPKIIPELPAGRYEIFLKKAGHQNYKITVAIEAGQTAEIVGELQPLMGRLQVLVKPYGDIYVDGQRKSKNVFEENLAAGMHKIYIVCERKEWEEAIDLDPNQTHTLEVDFDQTVRVNVIAIAGESSNIELSDLWGTIYVDGQSQEVETPHPLTLHVGLHVIEVRREGFAVEPASMRINLKEDRKKPLEFKLVKKTN